MNTLSWMIYLASVISGIKGVIILSCCGIGLGLIFYVLYNLIDRDRLAPHLLKLCFLLFGLSVFAALIPDERTVYAIAASEMGEVVVKSEEAQEVFKALKDRVMDELKVEEKKD